MLMLPILMYHKVDVPRQQRTWRGNYVLPDQFELQLKALRSCGYTTITLEDWLDFRAGRRTPPRSPIAITFDDGYRSNFDIAWPILKRYDAVATIFLVANMIGTTNLWDINEPQEPLLGTQEILKMNQSGIRFGSHTCTHRALVDLSLEEARNELMQSKIKIEAITHRVAIALAYPYNKQTAAVRVLAKGIGFGAAVVGRGRINASWTNPLLLRRIRVDIQTTAEELGRRLRWLRWLPGV